MVFKPPQDIVAIFHVSFHPTRGNVLDWYFSADDDLDVESLQLEFSALPSGLHQLDEDVVYFTTSEKRRSSTQGPSSSQKSAPSSKNPPSSQTYHALALFRRRRTAHPLYRGFLLGSLGILVLPRERPREHGDVANHAYHTLARPWRHLLALKEVAERCYSRPGSEPNSIKEGKLVDVDSDLSGSPSGEWFEPAKAFFELRKHGSETGEVEKDEGESSSSWKDELHDEVRFWLRSTSTSTSSPSAPSSLEEPTKTPPPLTHITPTLALPSLLTLLGPASLTLYRHLITRKRILFYTKPPVQYACVVCYAAADMVRTIQKQEYEREMEYFCRSYEDNETGATKITIPPRHKPSKPSRILGMITLHDLLSDKLNDDNENDDNDNDDECAGGRGWIACTTDALFLEKPAHYDLLVDLTSVGVSSSSTSAYAPSTSAFSPSGSGSGPLSASSAASWVFGSGSSSGITGRPRPTMYVSEPKVPTSLPMSIPPAVSVPRAAKNANKAMAKMGKSKKDKENKKGGSSKKQVQYRRVQTRWAWSDARLWGELDKVLRAAAPTLVCGNDTQETRNEAAGEVVGSGSGSSITAQSEDGLGKGTEVQCKTCGGPLKTASGREGSPKLGKSNTSTPICTHGANTTTAKLGAIGTGAGAWLADVWQMYEEVCLVCAGAWMGTLRTRNLGVHANTDPPPRGDEGELNLKRTYSTPHHTSTATWGGSSRGGGKGNYAPTSMTMPVGRQHKHGRSVSETKPTTSGAGLGTVFDSEEPRLPELVFEQPSAEWSQRQREVGVVVVNGGADDDDDDDAVREHTHDFTLVSPPTPDTREGLEILLHTAGSVTGNGSGSRAASPKTPFSDIAFPPNLAEAVSKTEGVLGVLDVYADWVVGLVKGKVGDAVRSDTGEWVVEEDEEGGDIGSGVEEREGEGEGANVRTSAIELMSVAQGMSRRSTPPPILPISKGKGRDKGDLAVRSVANTRRSRKKTMTMTVTPRDLLSLDLNPLSTIDVKYLESIVQEYASRVYITRPTRSEERAKDGVNTAVDEIRVNLVVKRGWRDLVGVVFGL